MCNMYIFVAIKKSSIVAQKVDSCNMSRKHDTVLRGKSMLQVDPCNTALRTFSLSPKLKNNQTFLCRRKRLYANETDQESKSHDNRTPKVIVIDTGALLLAQLCSKRPRIPHGATGKDTIQVSTTILLCEFCFYRILMDRANSCSMSYNIRARSKPGI